MRLRFTVICGVLSIAACTSTNAAQRAESEPTAATRGDAPDTASADGPFEVAERWIASPGEGPAAEIVQRLAEPGIERMHATSDGQYKALVVGAGGEDAVLLTLERRGDAWVVIAAESTAADYLWPTQ